jgi:hypothetical protein
MAVRNSVFFSDFLQVVILIFNYVNHGIAPTDIQGGSATEPTELKSFDVHDLVKLKDMKESAGPFHGYHRLHICLDQLLSQRQTSGLSIEVIEKELGVLRNIADIKMRDLSNGLKKLQDDRDFVYSELHGHGRAYATDFEFENNPEPVEEAVCPEVPEGLGPEAFSMCSNSDPESDDEDDREGSPGYRRRSLYDWIQDAANTAEAIFSGDHVIGERHEPVRGEICLAEDGAPPPPGALWTLRKSGASWRRCWAEVRASMLVLYKVNEPWAKGTTEYSET